MRCAACGHENPGAARFCGECGGALAAAVACRSCGTANAAGQKFCNSCGLALPGREESPLRAGQTPDSREALEGERRQLTVMFCDLVGSTELSEVLDPEEYGEAVRAVQQTSGEVIEQFGGRVAQHLGDGLLVYFGYPQAHEDDAVRAVSAALAILAELPELNERAQQRVPALDGRPLELRIGVHTGPVVVGEMGGGTKRERLAVGATVNVAARLQGVAEPNSVVISDATHSLARGVFVTENLGAVALKGIEQAVPTYRVKGATGVTRRLELAAARGLTPFVGRDQEVALLLDRWEQVAEGVGQVVLLSGEAGMGKSRLLQVLHSRLAESGRWLELHCSAYHQNSALHPVLEVLKEELDVAPGSTAATKVEALERALAAAGLDVPAALPLLAPLLSLPLDEHYTASVPPAERRQRSLEALASWILSLSEPEPLILVVEDLHWIDPSTLELLGLLIEQAPTARILLLPTFRQSFQPPWPSRSHVLQLTLNRLTRGQVSSLAQRVAGGKELPAEILSEVNAKTDGVPLFVEELTKTILESDLLQERGDRHELVGPSRDLAIPSTLQDSLMARLDRLGTAKEVAQLGAVLGTEFDYELLREVAARGEEELRADLARLEQAELLFRRGFPPRATYFFKHALVQETADQSLLRSRRRELHEHTARVLERQLRDGLEVELEVLANHLAEAGLSEPAVDRYQQAGDRARERSTYAEAVAHFERGLALLEQLPDSRERSARELSLQLALGLALQGSRLRGIKAPEVERAFTRALELCREAGEVRELFPALWGLWYYYNVQAHDYTAADRLVEQLLRLAETTQEPDLLLEAHHAAWMSRHTVGELTAAYEHTRAGLAIYRRDEHHALTQQFGNHDPGVCALYFGAWLLALLGYPEQSAKRMEEAIELADSLGHPFTRRACRQVALTTALTLRDVPAAGAQIKAAIEIARETGVEAGDPGGDPGQFFRWLQGFGRFHAGQTSEGIARMREGVEVMIEESDHLFPLTLSILCEVYAITAQPNEGLALLARTRHLIGPMGGNFNEAELHRVRGELLHICSTPEDDEAEAALRTALDVARAQRAKLLELRAATSLARLLRDRDRTAEGRALLGDVYEWFTEGFDTPDLKSAKAELDEPA